MASLLGVCIPGRMCTGGGIPYRGCTFITGGWHPPVLHPLHGGVPSSLGVCIPGRMCTGGGIHYRGCTFITGGWHPPVLHPLQGVYLHTWGCAYQDACVLGEGHPLQGVYPHDKKKSYQPVHSIGPISSPIEHTGW